MAVTVTNSTPQPIVVVAGETYIISPNFEGDVKFEASGNPATPVNFNIELNDSPSDPSESVSIKIYGDEGELSPNITVADNYNGPKTDFDLDRAADVDFTAGNNVTIDKIKGSKDGDDDITFGNDATVAGGIDTEGGSDTVVVGDNANFGSKTIELGGTSTLDMDSFTAGDGLVAKEIKGDDGDTQINIGDDAQIEKIETKDGDDNIVIGDDAGGPTPSKALEIKTGEGADTIVIGEDSTLKTVDTGEGDDNVKIGDGAQLDKLDMGKGADVARLGELEFAKSSSKITLDGGGSKTIDQDCLILDTSWLSPAEQQRFLDELEANGYVFDAGVGGYVEGDDGGSDPKFKQTFTLTLDSGNKIKFKDWEQIKAVCFARGTRIATMRGEVQIEDLQAGDRVLTMDNGYQEIRWIGSSRVAGHGHLAPVRIKAGALKNARDVVVSPQHRVLIKGTEMEMMFGELEALVAAKHLINGHDIVAEANDQVDYYHMLFEDHEIVFAEGMPSESFHPGAVGLGGMTDATRKEIIELFPELESDVAAYGPACRPSLRAFEAKAALRQAQMAAE